MVSLRSTAKKSTQANSSPTKFNWGLIFLVIILALGLRLPQLNSSFWLDEAAQALESIRPWSQQLQLEADFQPPLLHLITAVAVRISSNEWWLRLWGALLPGMVTIVFTYLIGRRIKNERVGLLAALFMATSSFHIFYSQELRPYALPAMWAALSWWWLLQATEREKAEKTKEKQPTVDSAWWWFSLSSLLGFYSSYLYPFLWLGQALWLLWQKRCYWKQLLLSGLVTALGFAPWVPSFLGQLAAGTAVRSQLPGWAEVVSLTQDKALPLVFGKFLFGVINLQLTPVFFIITLVFAILAGLIIHQSGAELKKPKQLARFILSFSWLLLPTLLAWLVSFWVPVVRPKRLLMVMPAFYLSFALMIDLARNKFSRKLGYLLSGFLLLINLFGVWRYSINSHYQRENWQELYQSIKKHYPPEETVLLFSFPEPFAPWRWYEQGKYQTISTGQLKLQASEALTQQIKVVANYRYVLLFDYLRDLTDPDDQLRTELWALGFHEIRALDYPGIGFVRVFTRNKITAQPLNYF